MDLETIFFDYLDAKLYILLNLPFPKTYSQKTYNFFLTGNPLCSLQKIIFACDK